MLHQHPNKGGINILYYAVLKINLNFTGGHQMEQLLFIILWNLPFLAIAAYIEKTKWF
jgi:hypothetical protein